jgi:hypothetical protein
MLLDLAGHPLHTRALATTVRRRDPDHVDVAAYVLDLRKRGFVPVGGDLQSSGIIHHMEIRATVATADRRVVAVEAVQPTVAFEASVVSGGESCRDPIATIRALAGTRLGDEWTARVGDTLGGPRACYHLFTLAHFVGSSVERALDREAALGIGPRPAGQRLFRRDVIVDGAQRADRSIGLAVQLLDLHTTTAEGATLAMDRFAESLELRGTVVLDRMTGTVAAPVFAERRREAATVATAPWTKRPDVSARLEGVSLLAGATRTLGAAFPAGGADGPWRDALLMLAPALIQVFAAITDDWSRLAQDEGWLVGMGGRPDSCWMWRRGGALERTRGPGDPSRSV